MNEKKTLLLLLGILFVMSAFLLTVMIQKDRKSRENAMLKLQQQETEETSSWPKVEIQTRN